MRDARMVDFLATSRASESSLLLGSHLWVVHNDSIKCSNEENNSYTINLTLHACDAEQFACNSAFCIAMEKRCDAREDCIDGSDEQDCGKLIIRQGYKKELAPVPETGQIVSVNFSLNILDIEINEPAALFTVRLAFTRTWIDGRLMYKHLKKGMKMKNTLLKEESDAIWHPYLNYNNVRNEEDNVKKTGVENKDRVVPIDDFKYEAVDNMHVFKGSENALTLTKARYVEWKCEYAYHWYPFDTQVCRMEFASLRYQTEFDPTQLEHNPNIFLNRYTLSRIRMCRSGVKNMKAIVAEVTLGRPIVHYLLTVFVPTILLLSISFATGFFAKDYFEMVIQVNLTILLVLATM